MIIVITFNLPTVDRAVQKHHGIARHQDGNVENWFKYERPKVFQDPEGRVTQMNFAVIDTLEYLRRGGRISSLQAGLGTMTKLKPVITVREGAVAITNKAFDSYEQGLIRDVISARIPARLDAAALFAG